MLKLLLPKHSPALRGGDFAPYLLRRGRHPALEHIWSEYLPDRALFATRAGRDALWRFLEATSPPPGSEVLVAAYNYYVVVQLLIQKGLRPVFVDVERDTLGMDPADLRRKISGASALVVATHMFGIPADIEAIARICSEAKIALFEDCAHAVGSFVAGRHVGRFGDGALFSFGPFKSVTCFGGGMLAVDRRHAARIGPERAVPLQWTGRWGTFFHMLVALLSRPAVYGWTLFPLMRVARRLAELGFTPLRDLIAPSRTREAYHFSPGAHPPFRDFMPSVLQRQLARLEHDVERRRQVVASVKHAVDARSGVGVLDEDRHGRANGSYFGLYVPDSESFAVHMLRRGIEVNPHEFYDCSLLPQFRDFAVDCPNAAYASRHLVRLPSYAALGTGDVARILAAINSYFTRTGPRVPGGAAFTTASSPGAGTYSS